MRHTADSQSFRTLTNRQRANLFFLRFRSKPKAVCRLLEQGCIVGSLAKQERIYSDSLLLPPARKSEGIAVLMIVFHSSCGSFLSSARFCDFSPLILLIGTLFANISLSFPLNNITQ